jgi:hypothetical protein
MFPARTWRKFQEISENTALELLTEVLWGKGTALLFGIKNIAKLVRAIRIAMLNYKAAKKESESSGRSSPI